MPEVPPPDDPLGAKRPPPSPPHTAWRGRDTRPQRRLSLSGALVLLALWTGATLLNLFPGLTGGLLVSPVPQMLATLILLAGLGLFRWSDTGLGRPLPGSLRALWLPWLWLPVFALGIGAAGGIPVGLVAALAAAMLWIALSEELMFRGLLYPALRRHLRPWTAIWLTSLLFGAVHLGNGWIDGQHALSLGQSLAAIATGLVLLAMRLRTGSIWPGVLYHLLWNVGSFGLDFAIRQNGVGPGWLAMPTPAQAFAVALGAVLPNFLVALWLLRGVSRDELPGDVPGPRPGTP